MTVIGGVDRKVSYCKSNVHPTDHLPEHCIPSVEIGVVCQVDVVLGTSTVRVCGMSHTKVADVVVKRAVNL